MDAENEFIFLPERASSIAWQTDLLYAFEWAVAIVFTVIVFVAIMFFAIRYRKGSRADRTPPNTHGKAAMLLELTWSIIPLILTMIMFVGGAALYFRIQEPPDNTMDLYVLGKQWMWKFQHPNGKREINDLHVPVGQPIKLKMISEDVIHSMFFPAFRVKQDVLPGRYTELWFEATKVGDYHIFCAEYCGTDHSAMIGTVHVVSQAEYADWLEGGAASDKPADELGQEIVERVGCVTCHKEQNGRGPSFVGLYGRKVPLKGGRMVVADDEYIRESIYDPRAKLHAGYDAVMPVYTKDELPEEDILAIIAYIKSLSVEDEAGEGMNGEDETSDDSADGGGSDEDSAEENAPAGDDEANN